MSMQAGAEQRYGLDDLLRIMERLRDPQTGCPWDREQDFSTVVPSTLEECYELAAAIEARDWAHVADELGDLLFQVVFYAQLGRERELFDFASVVHVLAAKLLRRHPHVFADGEIEGVVRDVIDSPAVKRQWEQIKARERAARAQHGVLDDVPLALPALPRAQKLQKRAARVGFDWQDARGVLDKLDEERGELEAALTAGDDAAVEAELGDLLFTAVNLARHLRIDAEAALRRASSRFEERFRHMEAAAAEQGLDLHDCRADELELLWARAKAGASAAAD
jgi:ATP diphosphatase